MAGTEKYMECTSKDNTRVSDDDETDSERKVVKKALQLLEIF